MSQKTKFDERYIHGETLMTWALRWFSMSNDAFYNQYRFNFNPHDYPGLYNAARKRYFEEVHPK